MVTIAIGVLGRPLAARALMFAVVALVSARFTLASRVSDGRINKRIGQLLHARVQRAMGLHVVLRLVS
jgi:hypothetical protein